MNLIQRLRKFMADDSHGYEFKCGDTVIEMTPEWAQALIEEIEYGYIPKPIADDGVPWQKDDDCLFCNDYHTINGFDGERGMWLYDPARDDYTYVCASDVERPKGYQKSAIGFVY